MKNLVVLALSANGTMCLVAAPTGFAGNVSATGKSRHGLDANKDYLWVACMNKCKVGDKISPLTIEPKTVTGKAAYELELGMYSQQRQLSNIDSVAHFAVQASLIGDAMNERFKALGKATKELSQADAIIAGSAMKNTSDNRRFGSSTNKSALTFDNSAVKAE